MSTLHKSSAGAGAEALEARFAFRLAARLSENTQHISPDVGERLRIGRERALNRAREARAAQGARARSGVTAAGAAILGGGSEWWLKLGAVVPLVALLAGLVLIQQWHLDQQISAAAEIDAALLADDVPPTAYSDPGFVEFLKTPRD
ncbi:MAG: hypothetical protein AD742_13150 [Methylibium sp. NZG]|nr:MAG: hypothetical protein AD742_13150 [Methylibium sp. NZG]